MDKALIREAMRLLLDKRQAELDAAERICAICRSDQSERNYRLSNAEAVLVEAKAKAAEADRALTVATAKLNVAVQYRETARMALKDAEEE